jgi:hypothetical protein
MARPFGTFKYRSVDELEKAIDKYFADCDERPVLDKDGTQITDKHGNPMFYPGKPYTMSDLAESLGITRQTLLNYSEKDDYFAPILHAREKVQGYAERRLYDKDGCNGAKFSLINNHKDGGWADKQEFGITANDLPTDPEQLRLQLKQALSELTEDEHKALKSIGLEI